MYIEISTIIYRDAGALEPADEPRVPMPEGLPWRRGIVKIGKIMVPWPTADARPRAM